MEFIRALVAYEATHAKELKKAFEDSVDDYLKLCEEQCIEAEIPFKGSLNVRLGQELHRLIAIAAARHQMSINKFIMSTLSKAIDQDL